MLVNLDDLRDCIGHFGVTSNGTKKFSKNTETQNFNYKRRRPVARSLLAFKWVFFILILILDYR